MKRLYFIFLAVVVFASCNNSSDTDGLEDVNLRQEWFANASYLGEVVAINETDSLYGLDINLIEGADDVDPIKMVISGRDKFGVAGADRIFTANEVGADLVVIGVVNYLNPTVFIAKEKSNIQSPQDFEGNTVGVFTGNNTEMIYRTLVRKANVDKDKITEIEASFDLGSFIAGSYDVRPAYIFDETVSLDRQDINYNIIHPQDYGVSFIGTVYFTQRSTVENQPELVQRFVNSIAKGWEIALENPDKALKYLAEYNSTIDITRERASFKAGIDYFRGEGDKVLTSDIEKWRQMGEDLVKIGVIDEFDVNNFVNMSFIRKYHKNNK
jgi:ABC-type nitrate/sulfonate/bicarbonate transport system substrate-binding protein